MRSDKIKIWLFIIGMVLLISSCGIKKNLTKDQYLINKYKISIDGKHHEISTSELRTLLSPAPNSKLFFFRAKLWVHYKYTNRKSKFNTWLNKHFGQDPVFYSNKNSINITRKMSRYLSNIGFFNADVSYKEDLYNNVANVNFIIKPNEPYVISEISYTITDSLLNTFFRKDIAKTLIKNNDIYNAYTLDDERDRISNNLRDNGYYFFNRNYIQFVIDSNFMDYKMKVDLVINNTKKQEENSPGDFIEEDHRRYFINTVTIIPEFDPTNTINYDTVFHNIKFWKDPNSYTYFILYNKGRKIHILPSAFNTAVKIKPGEPYSALNVQNTYRKFFNYQIIQTANISFDTLNTPKSIEPNHYYLNTRIQLRDSDLNRFSTEVEGTNSSGDLGIRGNLVFLNKNIFKQAEVLRLRLRGGLEAQTISEPTETSSGLFNTFEAGIDGTIFIPRFLSPIRLDHFNQKFIPNTNLNFGFNYQQRPYYSRNITNLDIGYSWKVGKYVNNIFTPANFNYVNINPTPEFDSILQNEPNRRLQEQYSDHMIVGTKYSFTFNNQNMMALQHFNYLRVEIESAGNLLHLINTTTNLPKTDSGYYDVMGVRYSQFFRFNIDYRHYYYFSKKTNAIVTRILFGAGIPYLNSEELPYEKGFFAGGANGMRGWLFKELGPGDYSGNSPYEKVGDIQIEGNLEYRFPIYGFFKGALFTDIGNIWTYKTSGSFPGGKFYFNKFVSQLAIDVGFGFRFDFKILIFRIDVAAPIRNPAFPEGNRWRIKYLHPTDIVWNFGIGYPF